MKSKTIGGVRFQVRKYGGLYIRVSDGGDCAVNLPRRAGLQLRHVQELQDWLKQLEQEIEDGSDDH